MFTGIIQNIGAVRSIDKTGDWRIIIDTEMDLSKTPMGASIACSGVCLTIVEKDNHSFAADVSAETLSKTTIKDWHEGIKINLETSLKMGDELGGHFVFGHVDGLATLESVEKQGDSHGLTIKPSPELMPYIASKGSITLDGISLTINKISDQTFEVNIVPHTWSNTTLGLKQPGDTLNIEIDMLARYVARQIETQTERKDAA